MAAGARQNGNEERRAQVRMSTERQIGCRVPASPVDAHLSDLSPEGCRIRLATPEFVQPGSTIVIQLGDADGVACRVIWIEGEDIGLRFYEPLDKRAVARALGQPEQEPPPETTGKTANRRLI